MKKQTQIDLEKKSKGKKRVNHEASLYELYVEDLATPLERIEKFGSESLTTAELLAVILGGSMEDLAIATNVRSKFKTDNDLKKASVQKLKKICEEDEQIAYRVEAALEFGLRLVESKPAVKPKIGASMSIAYSYMDRMKDYQVEVAKFLFLDGKNNILVEEDLFKGGKNSTLVDPKVVFQKAFEYGATQLIMLHNHPSGEVIKSHNDLLMTKRLKEISEICGIKFFDHIIIGYDQYYSFAEDSANSFMR